MNFKASQIAELVCGELDGKDVEITGFSKIEEARKGDITFLSNPKYTHYIYSTDASAALVRKDFKPSEPVKAVLIKVNDPYAAITILLEKIAGLLMPQPYGIEQPCFIAQGVEVPEDCYIGAFSYIASDVKLGKGCRIFPQSYIGAASEIGENTIIYSGVKIYHGCKIGDNCIIHSGAVIGADGFGFAPMPDGTYHKIPQLGIVEIEDNVEIGANTTIDRATMGSTIIKRGAKLDNLIQAAHNTEVGENTVMAAQSGIAGSTKLGNNCMVGGQVGFAGHIKVGNHVNIGAQSGVPNNVPDGSVIMGYPAVDASDFKRQAVYIKKLGELFKEVRAIEKHIKEQNQ